MLNVNYKIYDCRDVFRDLPNIYDRAFLRKQLTAKSRELLMRKSSFVDIRQCYKYAAV